MIFSGMTSSNTAEYKFYLKSGVIKFQFIIIIKFKIHVMSNVFRNILTSLIMAIKVLYFKITAKCIRLYIFYREAENAFSYAYLCGVATLFKD